MDVGVGLPSAIPRATGRQIIDWAARAEDAGFSTLGAIDRLVYSNSEPLVTLAAAAAVTHHVRLMTSILLAPLRVNAALLAKQIASVNFLSGGRLILGMAVGGYRDDYEASAVDFSRRGQRLDEMLAEMSGAWDGEPRGFAGSIGPPRGIPRSRTVFGGRSARTFARVAARGGGWVSGSRGIEAFREGAEAVRHAWAAKRRDGKPRLMAMPYFSLGPHAERDARAFLSDHYSIEGDAVSDVVAGALTHPVALREAVSEYEEAGCDELLLLPCSADVQHLDALADAVL